MNDAFGVSCFFKKGDGPLFSFGAGKVQGTLGRS